MAVIRPTIPGFDQVQVIRDRATRQHWVLTVKAGASVQSWPFSNWKAACVFGEDLASDYGVEYEEFDEA